MKIGFEFELHGLPVHIYEFEASATLGTTVIPENINVEETERGTG